MPIIKQFVFTANFREDGIVEILKDDIAKTGCISLATESAKHGRTIEQLRQTFSSMKGVTCGADTCCITDVSGFSANMKRLSGVG